MNKRRRLYYLLIIILILIGIGFLLIHPAFRIKTITTEGQNFIPSNAIIKRSSGYYNVNLFSTRYFSGLSSDLKATFPQIEKVKFKFHFPDGLVIRIIEKEPWTSFFVGDQTLWISEDGTVLNEGNNSPTSLSNIDKLLIIRGLGPEFFTGKRLNAKLLPNIQTTFVTIHQYFPNNTNLQLEFKQPILINGTTQFEELELLKDDTMRIKLGSFDKLETKVQMLSVFLNSIPREEQEHIQYIDLRIPPKVIVKDATP